MDTQKKEKFLQRMRDLLDGYCCVDEAVDERHLRRHGIKRLTATKDLNESPGHPFRPETAIEKQMAPLFSNTSSDQYFAAIKEGVEFLISIHYGQFYVGNDACEHPEENNTVYAFFCRTRDEDGETEIKLDRIDDCFHDANEASESLVAFLSQTDEAYIDENGFVHEVYGGEDQVYGKYFDFIDRKTLRGLLQSVREMGLTQEADYLQRRIDDPSLLEPLTGGPRWDFVLDDTAECPVWKHQVGMLTNGRRYIFYRVNENEVCSFYFRLEDLVSGYPDMECPWCSENDERLIDILNSEDSESTEFIQRVKERFHRAKNRGPLFVRAILAWLKEKGRSSVYFQPSTYDFEDDIPFCSDAGLPVETVFIPDEPEHENEIGITVWTEDGEGLQKFFDGTEPDEEFDYLFHEVWNYINDPEDGEADDWLEEFEASLRG